MKMGLGWFRWLTSLLQRRRFDAELDEEIQAHLEMAAEENRSRGMSSREAQLAARRAFGGIAQMQEAHRDLRTIRWLDNLRRDLVVTGRSLRKRPGFLVAAIATLAIGIGANTAVFSLVETVLFRHLPASDPESLVNIYVRHDDGDHLTLSYPDFEDLERSTTAVFSSLSAVSLAPALVDVGGEVKTEFAELVSGDYFSQLGLTPHLGRLLGAGDDIAPGAHPVVVLSYELWQREYGGDPQVVGQQVRVASRDYEIVGVGPPNYPGCVPPVHTSLYLPIMMIDSVLPNPESSLRQRDDHYLQVRARKRHGISEAQAQTAVSAVSTRLSALYPDDWSPGARLELIPSTNVMIAPDYDPYLRTTSWVVLVAIGLVLLIACTNLAGCLLARAVDREREIALRVALGATRLRLLAQMLTESTALGLLGGTAGVGLGALAMHALGTVDLGLSIPLSLNLSLDGRALAFCAATSLGAGLVLGLAPALHGLRTNVGTRLKGESSGTGGSGHLLWRHLLVVTQVAFSVLLLVTAGLLLRSLQQLDRVDPGFGRQSAAMISVMLNEPNATSGRRLTGRLKDRIAALPGVESVGVVKPLPLDVFNSRTTEVNADGVDPPPGQRAYEVASTLADTAFFDAAGIRIVEGRSFTSSDRANTARVAVVSEALARKFWGEAPAVGRTLRQPAEDKPDLLVVGVASDVKIHSLAEPPQPVVYTPFEQSYSFSFTLLASTSKDPEQLARTMLSAAHEVEPDLLVWQARSLDRHIDIHRLPARISATILTLFATVALALAAIGLYGLVSYAVSQRAREVGIRIAMGANTATILRLLTGSGLRLVGLGGAIGLIGAVLLGRFLRRLLFGVEGIDPLTLGLVVAVMMLTAIIAAYAPARRASRLDPVKVLRAD